MTHRHKHQQAAEAAPTIPQMRKALKQVMYLRDRARSAGPFQKIELINKAVDDAVLLFVLLLDHLERRK